MPIIIAADPIPIPADNEAGGVNITGTKGYIHINSASVVTITSPGEYGLGGQGAIDLTAGGGVAVGGAINLICGDASAGEGGGFSLRCGNGTVIGGGIQLQSGTTTGESGDSANVLISPSGADSEFIAASSGSGRGSNLELGGGSGTVGGDLILEVGSGTNAHTDNGKIKFAALGGTLADANNGQGVTFGLLTGPGGSAVSIKRWIPVTVDGQAGWLPHFGV